VAVRNDLLRVADAMKGGYMGQGVVWRARYPDLMDKRASHGTDSYVALHEFTQYRLAHAWDHPNIITRTPGGTRTMGHT
jgi:hypothetical protein